MCEVIVVASGKGGTGKTTVCAGLGVALAKQNKRVLIMDCDSGMRGIDMVLGVSDKLVYDLSDVISGSCEMADALYQVEDGLQLYCIAAPLYADDEVSPSLVKRFVDKARGEFDYILIDSPAGTGSGFVAAASAADRALVVVNAEPISIRGGKNIVHLTQGNQKMHFFYDGQGKPSIVEWNNNGTIGKYAYVYNLQGDVIALVNSAGTKVVNYAYDAWGKPLSKTGTLAGTLGTLNPFRYRGYVYDDEIDFYYLRSRYYNANRGRFISSDSRFSEQNLFVYCGNNTGYSDHLTDLRYTPVQVF